MIHIFNIQYFNAAKSQHKIHFNELVIVNVCLILYILPKLIIILQTMYC